jgi:archaellum component FlaF (FlaF/FlaG flagellin family)
MAQNSSRNSGWRRMVRWAAASAFVGTGALIALDVAPAAAQTPPGPVITVTPFETDLGEIRLHASKTAVLNIANAGPGSFTVTTIAKEGNAADEAVVNNPCTTIPANSSCNFSVTMTPDQRGSRHVAIGVASSTSPSPNTVTIDAVGVASEANPDVTSLAFDETPVDSASVTKRVTFTNNGTASLNTSGVTIGGVSPGDFKIVGETCTAAPVAPNGSCTVDVSFKPLRSGSRLAALQLASDAEPPATASTNGFQSDAFFTSAATTTSISLSGTGQSATATIAPATIDYGPQVVGLASTKTVTVTNNGPGPLAVRTAAVTGTNAADWTVSNNRCTALLASGASCTIDISFIPSAVGGRSASLVVTDSSQAGGGTVALSGTGTAAPAGSSQSAGSGGTGATATAAGASAAKTTTAAAAATGALPATGTEVRPMVDTAVSLLLIGFGLVLLPLQRRRLAAR